MQQGDLWGIPEPRKLRDLVVLSFLARFPRLTGPSYADCKRVSFSALAIQETLRNDGQPAKKDSDLAMVK